MNKIDFIYEIKSKLGDSELLKEISEKPNHRSSTNDISDIGNPLKDI